MYPHHLSLMASMLCLGSFDRNVVVRDANGQSPPPQSISRGYNYHYPEPLTNKQKKARNKAKMAKLSKKRNRK